MTPEDAAVLSEIVERIDESGGRVRDADIDHEPFTTNGLSGLINQLSRDENTRPVYTLEIVPTRELQKKHEREEEDTDSEHDPDDAHPEPVEDVEFSEEHIDHLNYLLWSHGASEDLRARVTAELNGVEPGEWAIKQDDNRTTDGVHDIQLEGDDQ
jgi:ABC-type Zn2+ transport system substrate-binding protein/surface adhesin